MENQNPRVSILWEHSLTNLLGHDSTSDPGIALRQWVHFQGVHNILDLLSWDQEELKAVPAQQVYSLDDHGQGLYLRMNQIKQMCGLITYMKHVFGAYNSDIDPRDDPFHPFSPEEWSQHTSTMLRTYLIQHLPNPNGPEPVPSGPIPSSRPKGYSPAAIELMDFKKGIKREISAYPSLKDERYFDGFKRSLFIVAKTHECNEVLDPNYTPGSEPEEKELFEAKQTFMFSVFNANLQTDMGKTIVREHLANTDAQAVWKELSEHMRTSSKGASEKRRLTQYVTIPDDPILNFVNSQCDRSEDLDQALQAYQAYQVPCPQDSTMTPERTINHHFTYHIAQASQAKHGSLVDRGANGGLAGSDVRILSRSSRKCTVTGIDSHELQGLDVVQYAALVETTHGIVNLIMSEYTCYGKGHTIHSSGQIEWFKNSVDDRSVQVGGKQRIYGYSMPLTCRGGLMYLSILGKPTDSDLERYPAVHLTRPHEWDPSVLDYTH